MALDNENLNVLKLHYHAEHPGDADYNMGLPQYGNTPELNDLTGVKLDCKTSVSEPLH